MPRKRLETIGWDGHVGLESEYRVDPETGDYEGVYKLNGELVDKIKISGRIADRASALSLIHRDLNSAKDWYLKALSLGESQRIFKDGCNYEDIKDLDISSEIRGLFVASIIFYGKAFAAASGRKIKMEKLWLDPEFHEKHDIVIGYRNNFAAHSGDKLYESAETSILLLKINGRTIYQSVTDRKQTSFIGLNEDDGTLVELFDHAIKVVGDKYNETLQRVRQYVEEKSLSFWQAAAKKNEIINLDSANKNK